jgi:hypothetical protein
MRRGFKDIQEKIEIGNGKNDRREVVQEPIICALDDLWMKVDMKLVRIMPNCYS